VKASIKKLNINSNELSFYYTIRHAMQHKCFD